MKSVKKRARVTRKHKLVLIIASAGIVVTSIVLGLSLGLTLPQLKTSDVRNIESERVKQTTDLGNTQPIEGVLSFSKDIESIDAGALYQSRNLEEIVLPVSISSVPVGTFIKNDKLTKIELSKELYNDITGIGTYQQKASRLDAVFGSQVAIYQSVEGPEEFLSHKLATINNGQTDVISTMLTFPEGTIEINTLEYQNREITKLVLPSSLERISDASFIGNKNLKTVILSPTLYNSIVKRDDTTKSSSDYKLILDAVFGPQVEGYFSPQNAQIPYTAHVNKVIKEEQYLNQKDLTTFTILTGVTTIGARAFKGTMLSTILISDFVTSIEEEAFADIPTLSIVRLKKTLYDQIAGTGTIDEKKENLRKIFGPQVRRYESSSDPTTVYTDHLFVDNGQQKPDKDGVLSFANTIEAISGSDYRGLKYKGSSFTELILPSTVKEIARATFANNHELLVVRMTKVLYDYIVGEGTSIEKQRELEAIFGTQVESYLSLDGSISYKDHVETEMERTSVGNGVKFNNDGKIDGNVFIYVSGQSNAIGPDIRSSVVGAYDIQSSNVEVLNKPNKVFVPLAPKNNFHITNDDLRGRKSYSIAAKFADEIGKITTGQVKVAGFARQGAGFQLNGNANNLTPVGLDEDVSARAYNAWLPSNLINLVTGVTKPYLKDYQPIFFWHQGEADARGVTTEQQYFDFLATMISTYRDIIQNQEVPFLLGGYQDTAVLLNLPNQETNINRIERVNKLLADTIPNVGYASARGIIGNSSSTDLLHFGANSIEEFAARYIKEAKKNANDLNPPNKPTIKKGEYKLYSEVMDGVYNSSVGNNWIKIIRNGDDKTASFSKLGDIWKYRNEDGYKFKYMAYNGTDKLEVIFKQNINPLGILHSERSKLKDLLEFQLLSVTDTTGRLNIDNISFDALTIWDTNNKATLNASKLGPYNNLGHNFALDSSGNKTISSIDKGLTLLATTDRVELYAIKD